MGAEPALPSAHPLYRSGRRIERRQIAGPEQLLGYLGRYTHRVAISNHRIVSLDKDTVCFRWRDYADGNRQKVMCLSHEEFIRRFLQHCLPARFCKIRYSSPAEALAKEGRHPVEPVAPSGFGPLPAGIGNKPAASASGSILAGALSAGYGPCGIDAEQFYGSYSTGRALIERCARRAAQAAC